MEQIYYAEVRINKHIAEGVDLLAESREMAIELLNEHYGKDVEDMNFPYLSKLEEDNDLRILNIKRFYL